MMSAIGSSVNIQLLGCSTEWLNIVAASGRVKGQELFLPPRSPRPRRTTNGERLFQALQLKCLCVLRDLCGKQSPYRATNASSTSRIEGRLNGDDMRRLLR